MKTITKFDVVSLGKVMGLTYAVIGFFVGLIFSVFSFVGVFAATNSSFFGALFGIFAIILLPIFYGIMGFVSGVISALVYNIIANKIGGIKLELK